MPIVCVVCNLEDELFVEKLGKDLAKRGARVKKLVLDAGDGVSKMSLVSRLNHLTMPKGEYVVAVISTNSIKSKWLQKELPILIDEQGGTKKVSIVPITLGIKSDSNIPQFLRGKICAYFEGPEEFEKPFLALLQALNILLPDSEAVLAPKLIREIKKGDKKAIENLLEKSTRLVDSKDQDGKPALIIALESGNYDILDTLLDRGADVDSKDKRGRTALIIASQQGLDRIVNALLNRGAEIDSFSYDQHYGPPLVEAAKEGHLETVRILLDRGANINQLGYSDTGAIIAAAYGGRTPLMIAAKRGHVEIVRLLIDKGADINVIGYRGTTALINAAGEGGVKTGEGHVEIVRLLIEKGADLDVCGKDTGTARRLARGLRNDDIAKILKSAGAK